MKLALMSLWLGLFLFNGLSNVYAYGWNECWGTSANYKWDSATSDTFKIASDSMNSSQESYVSNIFQSWERVDESNLNLRYSFATDNDGKIKEADGRSEIGIVTDASFEDSQDDDTGGVASYRGTYNFISGECHFSEVDIIIPDSSTDSDSEFQEVFTHELGHGVGMAHTTDYGHMLATGGGELHKGNYPAMPLPDETQGIGDQYSSGSSHTDLGTSHFEVIKDTDASDEPDEQYVMHDYSFENDFSVCPGDTIEPLVTTLNYGTAEKSAKNKFFLSNDYNSSSPGVVKTVETFTTTIGAHKDYVRTLSMTVPRFGLSYGTPYYLYAKIDSDSAISEKDETNNQEWMGFVKIKSAESCPALMVTTHKVNFENIYNNVYATKWSRVANIAKKSIHIISGTITSKEASKVGDTIQTTYKIEVKDSYRGASVGETLTVIQKGGAIDGVNAEGKKVINFQANSHYVDLEIGQTYLLFLGGAKNSPIVGGNISVLTETEKSGKKYLQTIEGAKFFDLQSDGSLTFKTTASELSTSCSSCKDVDTKGKSRAVQVISRTAGKAISKDEFIAKLKTTISANPYSGKNSTLASGIDTNGLELVTQ